MFSQTKTTGSFHTTEKLSASWKAPMFAVPSPKKHTATCSVPRYCALQAAPASSSLPPDEARARRSMQHMFRIARLFRRAIDRIYVYQWSAFETDRFDAGVVNPDGSPRSSYFVLRQNRRFIR